MPALKKLRQEDSRNGLSYCSIAVIKRHDQGDLETERSVWLMVPEGKNPWPGEHGRLREAQASHLEPHTWNRGRTRKDIGL